MIGEIDDWDWSSDTDEETRTARREKRKQKAIKEIKIRKMQRHGRFARMKIKCGEKVKMILRPKHVDEFTMEEQLLFEEMEAEEEKTYKEVAAILGLEASGVLASRFGTRDGWRKVDMAEELDQK